MFHWEASEKCSGGRQPPTPRAIRGSTQATNRSGGVQVGNVGPQSRWTGVRVWVITRSTWGHYMQRPDPIIGRLIGTDEMRPTERGASASVGLSV